MDRGVGCGFDGGVSGSLRVSVFGRVLGRVARPYRALPGFWLTLGMAAGWIGLIVVLPLLGLGLLSTAVGVWL